MTPDSEAALYALSRSLGIASNYTDVWGQEHRVPVSTHQALLRALGVNPEPRPGDPPPAPPDAASLLDPVYVRSSSEPVVLTVRPRADAGPVQWTFEHGERTDSGHFDPEALERSGAPVDGRLSCLWTLPLSPRRGQYVLTLRQNRESATAPV
ncbi:MAG TPA: hypothetical protein VFN52_05775, partial [Acidiferrobacteraceae bacterium]|nr:hypothetical protein [Acidiferrobacteraceae bacterium]